MRPLRLPRSLRGVASILAGSVAGQGLVVLAYPLLTRLYDPAEFGLLTVFTSVVSMLAVVSTATLQAAIPLPVEDRDASAVAWAGLSCVGATTVITAALGLVVAGPVADLLGVPQLAGYWWLLALTVLVMGVYLVLSEWMVRDRSYAALGWRNVLQGVSQVATQVGLGAAGVRPIGLLLGLGVGRLAGLGGLVSGRGLLRQARPTVAMVRAAFRRFRAFPLLATPSALVNTAGLEVPLLLVAAIYGDARAGLLGLTVRVIQGPLTIIGMAVKQVFTGESSAELREPTGRTGASVRRAVGRMLLVGAAPAAVLVAFGPDLFGLVFGPQWTEAGDYARWLAVAYLTQFAIVPVSSTLFLLERQGRELGWAVLRLLLTAGGPAICGLLGAPMSVAILTLAAGSTVAYLALYYLCLRAADASDQQFRSRTA